MKRLLLPLIAALALPTAAQAESYKLLVKVRQIASISTSVMTMASKELCEEGKKKVLQMSQWEGKLSGNSDVAAICIKSE